MTMSQLTQKVTLTFLFISCFSSAFSINSGTPRPLYVCPPSSSLGPCMCYVIMDEINLLCTGEEVTQEVVDGALDASRLVNNIGAHEMLEVSYLSVSETNMTQFDLTHLLNTSVGLLSLSFNPFMTSLVGGSTVEARNSNLSVYALYLQEAGLTDDALAVGWFDLVSLTWPTVRTLMMSGNPLTDVTLNRMKNLFPHLTALDLGTTGIQNIEGGQFSAYGNIHIIHLQSNGLTKLGSDAFKIDEPMMEDATREIMLTYNKLNDSGIDLLALTGVNGATRLYLEYNDFEFLSEEKFLPFLEQEYPNGRVNGLILNDNHFVCDNRMKWLKDRREKFESRVQFVDCTNDPGHTIFTTDLV